MMMTIMIIIIIIILAYCTYTFVLLNEYADLKCGLVQHSSHLCVEVTGCLQDISRNSLNIVSGHWLGFFSPGAYCGSWSIQMKNCYACKNTTAYAHTHTHTHARMRTHTHTHTRARTHTHTCWFLWFTGTFHRRNGFYTVQTVCAIALHLPYT